MFYFEEINKKKVLKSDLLTGVQHFFTTRDSVVTAREIPEIQSICDKNLFEISKCLTISPENIISPAQTHSCNIKIAVKGETYSDTDALIIDRTDMAILLNFADCTPIILYDEINNIGAIAHAGWRGTAGSIVKKTVEFMQEKYSTDPKNITAVIGPAISAKNYQVDEPVFTAVKNTLNGQYKDFYNYDKNNRKYGLDLKTVNQHQLTELGVLRIDKCNYCTYDSNDVFFSYRKENGKTARHSAVLKLTR